MMIRRALSRHQQLQHQHQQLQQHLRKCNMSVYAIGEGWTGALGGAHLRAVVPGHNDENTEDLTHDPVLVYSGNVKQISSGWGHTLLIDQRTGLLNVVGRPHDFPTLLRLRRLPQFMRLWSTEAIFSGREGFEGWLIGKLVGETDTDTTMTSTWDFAKKYCTVFDFTAMPLPNGALPVQIHAGAGLSAVLGSDGILYSFGLNSRGQCGTGRWSNNQWEPTMVVGLTTQPDCSLDAPEHPVKSASLGFQSGVALNDRGRVFTWGKGHRGQLGVDLGDDEDTSDCARWIRSLLHDETQDDPSGDPMLRDFCATHVASGLHHGAMVLDTNQVYVWGKHQSPPSVDSKPGSKAEDAELPILVQGLPDLKILDVSCGSHHTALLMEDGSIWAFGLATDDMTPLHTPVQLCAPGMLQLPVRQFEAHFDRTTVVDANRDVYQMNLWNAPDLQEHAVFSPTWLDLFTNQRIQSVHRGWLYTLVVTEDDEK